MREKRINILRQLHLGEITSDKAFDALEESDGNERSRDIKTVKWVETPALQEQHSNLDVLLVLSEDKSFLKAMSDRADKLIQISVASGFRYLDENHYEIAPGSEEDYESLLQDLASRHIHIKHIVHHYTYQSFGFEEMDSMEQHMEHSVYAVFQLVKALMKKKIKAELTVYHQYEGRINPVYGAVSALLKSMSFESRDVKWKTVAYSVTTIPEVNTNELFVNDGSEVLYRETGRYVKEVVSVREPKQNKSISLRQHGTYVITGGLGAIGNLFAKYLMIRYKAKVILLGRTNPNAEKMKPLYQLAEQGSGEAVYISCDITNPVQVKNAAHSIKHNHKEISGIFHCAGIHKDSLMIHKSLKEFQEVISAKVKGTMLLLKEFSEDKLDFIILCSSVSGIYGNMGQCDYAFGNGFLDQAAHYYSGNRRKIISVSWPLWQEGGMRIEEDKLAGLVDKTGVFPISNHEGVELMELCLQQEYPQIIPLIVRKGAINETARDTQSYDSKVEKVDKGIIHGQDLGEKVSEYLVHIFHRQLKIPLNEIKVNTEFSRYGIDSIISTAIMTEIEKDFTIPSVLMYECQTILAMKDYLINNNMEQLNTRFGSAGIAGKIKADVAAGTGQKQISVPKRRQFRLNTIESVPQDDIAIIGISGRYPEASTLDEFWEKLQGGTSCIREIPQERWNISEFYDETHTDVQKSYTKWGGFVKDMECFDSLFFNISPRQAELMDPQERLFLEEAWHALENAGYTPEMLSGREVGVYVGAMYSQYQLYGQNQRKDGSQMLPGSTLSSIANRVSYLLNLTGPSMVIDTMCSSSLAAIHLACREIKSEHIQMAIVGGVNLSVHPNKFITLSQTGLISKDNMSKSFGAGGTGYVVGEGVGAVILKSLKKAEQDGDYIHSVIKGSGISHSGTTNGYMVPSPMPQTKLIDRVMNEAGVHPEDISYVEAQAYGSEMGDAVEVQALTDSWKKHTDKKQFCPIGSVKSNIGHLESASGMAALTKVVLQMKNKTLVPSIHADKLNPKINFKDSMFYVQKEKASWTPPTKSVNGEVMEQKRMAAINTFGAGGAYAHLILEEYSDTRAEQFIEQSQYIIMLSAKSAKSLRSYHVELAEWIRQQVTQRKSDNQGDYQEVIAKAAAKILGIGEETIDFNCPFEEYVSDLYDYEILQNELQHHLFIPVCQIKPEMTVNSLSTYLHTPHAHIQETDAHFLTKLAYTLQIGRSHFEEKTFYTVKSVGELLQKMDTFIRGEKADNEHELSIIENQIVSDRIKLWLQNEKVYFEDLYANQSMIKMPVLGYCFEKNRHWIETGTEQMEAIDAEEAESLSLYDDSNDNHVIEKEIKSLMSDLLKMDAEEIRSERNLKAYGVDSLTGMRMMNTLEEKFHIKMDVAQFVECKSVNDMVYYVSDSIGQKPFDARFNRFVKALLQDKTLEASQADELEQAIQHLSKEEPIQTTVTIDKKAKNKLYAFLLGELQKGFIGTKQMSLFNQYLLEQ